MCGSGQVTRQLLGRGAVVVGLDVSQTQLELFRRKYPRCDAVCASVTDSRSTLRPSITSS